MMRWFVSSLITATATMLCAGAVAAQEPLPNDDNAVTAPFECVQPAEEPDGSASSRASMLHLRAAVYDYVGAGSEVRFAQAIAAKRFARAGIAIDWVSCDEGSSIAYVNVLPPRMSARIPMPLSAMGFSWVGTRTASVAYARITRMAIDHRITPAHLLGYVIAHELGHLLLPPRSHSATGLMRENFDLERVRMMDLEFDRRQAIAMRASLMDPAGVFATK